MNFTAWKAPVRLRLLDGMRVAIREDFLDEHGNLILDKDFQVHSYHYERYEAHKTTPVFLKKWEEWLIDNRIYIKIKL